MELVHYRLTFDNQQEFFVESTEPNEAQFLKTLTSAGMFSSSEFISLRQSPESDPVFIKATKLFSVQRARKGIIGAQTKIWKVA